MTAAVKNRKRIRKPAFNAVFYIVTVVFLLWVLLPFYVVLVTSVTGVKEIYSTHNFIWWPENATLEAYRYILFEDPYAYNGVSSLVIGFFNTMWMTLLTTSVSLFVSSLAAYAYDKLRFPGKEKLFMLQIATMMIPTASMTVPSFIFYESIHWTDTVLPIIIPGMFGGGSAIFFFRAYFTGISNDLLEAAKIDGLGIFGSYLRVLAPLAIPAFTAQFIFMFIGGYNSYMGPLLYLQFDERVVTLQLAVSKLQGMVMSDGDHDKVCAVALTALLPLIAVFLACQRFFIDGIAVGGLKG